MADVLPWCMGADSAEAAALEREPTATWQQHHGRSMPSQVVSWQTALHSGLDCRQPSDQQLWLWIAGGRYSKNNMMKIFLAMSGGFCGSSRDVSEGNWKVEGTRCLDIAIPFQPHPLGFPSPGWEHVAAPSVAAVSRTRAVFAWTHCLKFSVTARRESVISLLFVSTVMAKQSCKHLSAWWKCFLEQHFC